MAHHIAELFAGIGGVTSGFSDTGNFRPVFLQDNSATAQKTFVYNHPELTDAYHLGDVEALTGRRLLDLAGGTVDGILGCPPCQGLSAAGLRDPADARNRLLHEMRRIVWSVRPNFFVLENVPSILNTPLFDDFKESLSTRYVFACGVLNAAEFKVPQLRRRAIVLGISRSLDVEPSLPRPMCGGKGKVFNYNSGRLEKITNRRVRHDLGLSLTADVPAKSMTTLTKALGDLPPAASDDLSLKYRRNPETAYQSLMRREGKSEVTHHNAWRHRTEIVKRLSMVQPGDCPSQYGDRARNTRYFSQAYSRLHGDGLARTVTTNFHNPGSGRFTHYSEPRSLTVREALRLQGFPDHFAFPEDIYQSQAEQMIGNAFPRPLATAIAKHINQLFS